MFKKKQTKTAKEILTDLQKIVHAPPPPPIPFFCNSKGDLIDLRTKKDTKEYAKSNQSNNQILTLKDLFCDEKDIERCFQVLRDLEKPFITADNKYIGKSKGIIPLWIKVLKNQKPKTLINTKLSDKEISIILNDSIDGLRLSKDASEFRKDYVLLEKNKIEIEIKTLLASK